MSFEENENYKFYSDLCSLMVMESRPESKPKEEPKPAQREVTLVEKQETKPKKKKNKKIPKGKKPHVS